MTNRNLMTYYRDDRRSGSRREDPLPAKLLVVIALSCGHTRHEVPPVTVGQDTFCRECMDTVQITEIGRY